MHILRLIDDEGNVIREHESSTPWTIEHMPSGSEGIIIVCRGSGITVYPAADLTLEILEASTCAVA